MNDRFTITSPSPDQMHTALLTVSGEIRFGPLYYRLSVNGYSFDQRIFGDIHLWSPSSTLLAVQEWLTLDYSEGPITALVLIDVQLRRETILARATKRFLVPLKFDGGVLTYREDYAGHEDVASIERDISQIRAWKTLP